MEEGTRETLNQGYDAARAAANKGYDAAREAAGRGIDAAAELSSNLKGFVLREPLLALAAAFAIGYTLARMMRSLPS